MPSSTFSKCPICQEKFYGFGENYAQAEREANQALSWHMNEVHK